VEVIQGETMKDYGNYGRPILLFEAYEEWRDDVRSGRLELEEADTRFDFPSFLFGPVRQSLWYGYDRVGNQYKRYARVESAPDFRERRLYGLTGMTKPGYVGEHGEFPQMTRGERPPATLVVDTYGGTYSMTRHLIINDESNELLNSAPEQMGESMAEFVVETIIALIESNPTAPDGAAMWSTGRGNQITGNDATAGLSEDTLATGISRMTRQRDFDNRRIRVSVKSLVVGDPRLELIARRILRSSETGTTSQTSGTGTASSVFDKGTYNPIQGLLPEGAVVYDPYLSDTNDWYLFADPDRVPAFAVGFLNGQERPQVFLKNPEYRNILGGGGQESYTFEIQSIDWLVREDFGAAPVDPMGTFRAVVS
jgi:hypothetical protein